MDEASAGSPAGDGFVKVVFELPREGDGWPPAGSEGLWEEGCVGDAWRAGVQD